MTRNNNTGPQIEQKVSAVCRAVRRELGCSLTSVCARPWRSGTFAGLRAEIEVDADLPAGVEDRSFYHRGGIVADVAMLSQRTLSMTIVDNPA